MNSSIVEWLLTRGQILGCGFLHVGSQTGPQGLIISCFGHLFGT